MNAKVGLRDALSMRPVYKLDSLMFSIIKRKGNLNENGYFMWGKGTRLAPFTYVLPKPMMPIGDKAILEVLLQQLRRYGFTEIVLAVGYLASLMKAYFKDGQQYDLNITYSNELEPLGTAGPLAQIPELNETLLVCNGDVLSTLNFHEFYNFHKEQEGILTIAMHQRQSSILTWESLSKNNGEHVITNYIEKPSLDYKVSMGFYFLEPRALEFIPQTNTSTSPTW